MELNTLMALLRLFGYKNVHTISTFKLKAWFHVGAWYIYVIYRAGGPYGKKLCPRSWVRPEAEAVGAWGLVFIQVEQISIDSLWGDF